MLKKLIFISLLASCSPGSNKEVGFNRKTTDASELFFKNIRKSSYQLQELKAAGMDIYTHKDFLEDMPMKMDLIHHWRDDRASIMVDFKSTALPVTLQGLGNQGNIQFNGESIQNHIDFAIQLYIGIMDDKDLSLDGPSGKLTLNDHPQLKEVIRITLVDFINLTENQKFIQSLAEN